MRAFQNPVQVMLALSRTAVGFCVQRFWLALFLSSLLANGQVQRLEISPIPSPQHEASWPGYPVQPYIPLTVTARGTNGELVPINGDAALTAVVDGIADYTFTFENLDGWTRLNPSSSYAVTSFDVNGSRHASPALDMRLNAGLSYGISRQIFLRGGIPYKLSIDSAVNSEQELFYGGPPVPWSLSVGTETVGVTRIGLGYLYPIDTVRLGVSGVYVPPTNGNYTLTFSVEIPFSSAAVHVYADALRIGYPGITPAVVPLANGQGSVSILCDRPISNLVLRATDAQGHTGDSNPFTVEPSVNLQLYTILDGTPRVGNDIPFTLYVDSLGPSTATGVTLTNILPPGLTLVSAVASRGTWTYAGGAIRCQFGAPPTSSEAGYAPSTLELVVRAAAPGRYTNQASVGANEYDLDESPSAANRSTSVITVAPSEVDRFDFAPVAVGVTSTVPFLVSITARDTNGAPVPSFTGPVRLSALGDLGFIALLPTTTAAFSQGSWTRFVTITNGAHTHVRLVADDGAGHSGQSGSFTVYAAPSQQTRILAATIVGQDVQLQFSTVNGRHYAIETTTNLTSAAWTAIGPAVTGTGNAVLSIHKDGAQSDRRFYRITLQP